jgi:hypothetical protein
MDRSGAVGWEGEISSSPRLGDSALVDGENFDFVAACQDNFTRGSANQSPRDRRDIRYRPIPRIRFVFPSCPETIGEISHIPRGERDRATTFGRVLDPLRGVIGSATFPHRIGQRE